MYSDNVVEYNKVTGVMRNRGSQAVYYLTSDGKLAFDYTPGKEPQPITNTPCKLSALNCLCVFSYRCLE